MESIVSSIQNFASRRPIFASAVATLFGLWSLKKLCRNSRKSVTDKIIVITGAGSGLGRLFAQRFAALGAKLALLDMSEAGLAETAKILDLPSERIFTHVIDVTCMEKIIEAKKLINSHFNQRIYMLINNAGVVAGRYIDELSEKDIRRTIDVNLVAPAMLTSVFFKDILENGDEGGHIVNIGSAAGHMGVSKMTDYCASKAGLIRFSDALREEIRNRRGLTPAQRKNICSTIINPYFIATGMFQGVATMPVILPLLTPDWVIDRSMDAILRNESTLNMPFIVQITPAISAVAPYLIQNAIANILQVSQSMETFIGRSICDKK
eukprot:GDKJ01017794.1.p1 GENE.GDKJ01017794.1~~GDKJ01017794.1.p1  ORF type:complete len:323 (-),score=63.78 GDKJ01017794.1:2581-3549(-)